MSTAMSDSQIQSFYSGRNVLVTGGTGFIGKVLIEKLLRSCPNINKIYLLIRPAHGKSVDERLKDLADQRPLNFNLTENEILQKLVPIRSDLALPGLGICDKDRKLLIENVSIIFHIAASVKFEAPLEYNMLHNVLATKELLKLATEFVKLDTFIHVSTAYSNCHLNKIDERVYKVDLSQHNEFIQQLEVSRKASFVDSINPKRIPGKSKPDCKPKKISSALNNHLIQYEGRPNTYAYTKAIAENVVQQYSKKMNVAIVRPSIVMSAIKEPAEGWVDSLNGPVGLSVVGALGILQAIDVNSHVVFDLIPVDIVSNAIVSIAWAVTDHKDKFKTKVFNLTSGNDNPCSFYQYFHAGRLEAAKRPSMRTLRPLLDIPLQTGMHPIKYTVRKLISHLLFAYLIDMILSLCGKRRMVVKAVNKMHHANRVFDFFCSNQWSFTTDNVGTVIGLLNKTDTHLFNFNIKTVDWKDYARLSWLGCRRYILKEDDSTLDQARKRYNKMDLFVDENKYRVFGDSRDADYLIIGHSPLRMVAAVSLYLASLLAIKIYMRNREPFVLATPMRIYNLLLVAINCYLVIEICREFDYGRDFFQCYSRRHHKMAACAYIGDVFLRTRILEFMDTIFFALRKKNNQISFLHVFHHSYVPVLGYLTLIADINPMAILFAYVNSLVHIIMYTYYYFSTFTSLQPYLWWKKYLTQLQMLQFAIVILCSVWGLWAFGDCQHYPKLTLYLNLTTASIFMALFIRFFITSYMNKRPSSATKSQKSLQ
ncbi:Fatty acyl-CoA reductase 1 [Fragariocoptes setiger]|uniref:Fatty acyl-CoA reductase n=1 Tax=Fragariocoptes setiger TaxID=1670756 RepID=A0ABQ7SDK4_9ACAR|nr:Fatty acyl-CoA reductase 1 [Fragariocoptes setiger]